MTDPHAGPSDGSDGELTAPLAAAAEQTVPLTADAVDQTIPLVPDAGYAPAAPQPLPEATLVDALGASDPWASGPGLGSAAGASASPATQPPAAPAAATWGYPQPSSYAAQSDAHSPQASAQAAYGQATTPAPWPQPVVAPAPQPAPLPPTRSWDDGFPEPEGPAAGIVNQPYAPSPYAGQQWPAPIQDPVAYNYAYAGFDAAIDHPNAMPSLVMGIIGLTFFSPLAPFAWYMAAKGQREARLDPGRWRTGGTIVAGKVLGIIGTVILALAAFFLLFIFIAVLMFGA